jgi:general secretion pathway protein I
MRQPPLNAIRTPRAGPPPNRPGNGRGPTCPSARSRRSSGKAGGFALLEVMVAFIIAAAALGALFQSGLASLHSMQTASRYEEALARARSRLALATHGAPLVPGNLEGEDGGGYHWRVRVAPVSNTAVRPFGMRDRDRPTWINITLYDVTVLVSWTDHGSRSGGTREVVLNTQQTQAGTQ